jgi:hypothetical protein
MNFPELPTDVRTINQRLKDYFGLDSVTGRPMWKVSWSNDQFEKRTVEYTPEGLALMYPQVMEMPKYSWIKDRWILERLVMIPDINRAELPADILSYECMYIFENPRTNDALPPKYEACRFVIDTVYAAMGKSSLRKYVDEEANHPVEHKQQRIDTLVEELFGDESSLLGRTITGEAVAGFHKKE